MLATLLRLCIKHTLPPLRNQDEEESSESSDDSASSSDDEAGEPRANKPGRKADPEAKALQKCLKPFLQASRGMVQWHRHNSDAAIQLEKDAKAESLHYQAFAAETPTRWSSSMVSLMSTLQNNQAHMLSKHRHNTRAPDGFNQEQVNLGRQLCSIFMPFRLATKLLEGDKLCLRRAQFAPEFEAECVD